MERLGHAQVSRGSRGHSAAACHNSRFQHFIGPIRHDVRGLWERPNDTEGKVRGSDQGALSPLPLLFFGGNPPNRPPPASVFPPRFFLFPPCGGAGGGKGGGPPPPFE